MRKRGSASVLAMIFLVVFGALSCAFYVMVNTSLQVGKNDRNSIRARSAAESGMEVIKHHLSRIKISEEPSEEPDIKRISYMLVNELMADTNDIYDPTASTGVFRSPETLRLEYPELKLNSGETPGAPRTFLATLRGVNVDDPNLRIYVAVDGEDKQTKLKRSMAAVFYARPTGRGIFDYDVASAGKITLRNGAITRVGLHARTNVMSASENYPSIHIDKAAVTGGLGVVVSESQVTLERAVSVNGITDPAAILEDVTVADPPTIPSFPVTDFINLVPMTTTAPRSISPGMTLTNTIIAPSRSDTTVTRIAGGATLNGIIYVKSPNKIEFGGSVTLNGIIVFEPPAAGYTPTPPDYLAFSGNLTQHAAAAASYVPAEVMPKIVGYTILSPSADVMMSGNTGSVVEGSIICNTFNAENAAFTLNVNNGTILTLSQGPNAFELGQGEITFTRTAFLPPTFGVYYLRQYVMDPTTYEEIFQ